jgi:hypothetical protein
VEDVGATRSYDLHCSARGRHDHYVEVKGTTGRLDSVVLTANEVALARKWYPHTALYVVHQVELTGEPRDPLARGGCVCELNPWLPEPSRLTATIFRYRLADERAYDGGANNRSTT